MIRFRFRAEGSEECLSALAESLGSQGMVKRRRHSGEPLTSVNLVYWESHEQRAHAGSEATNAVEAYITRLRRDIASIDGDLGLAWSFVLVLSEGKSTGVYLSPESIKGLGDLGAGVDVNLA